jgi:hypothetical protein
VHEIKHDGFRLMVCRDAAGVRLLTRNGHDWAVRNPLIADAAGALQVRSFLSDGEAVACDGHELPVFDRLRYRRADHSVFLFAFRAGPAPRAPRSPQAPARELAAPGQDWLAGERARRSAERGCVPASLQARVGGHRLEAAWLARPGGLPGRTIYPQR